MAYKQLAQSRDTALDGLRGWSALSVVIYHCLWQTYGTLFPELHNFVFAVLGNGILAVGIFLTISGYVLTRGRWRRDDNPALPVAFFRRYVRLTLPIIVASLLVYALLVLALTPTQRAFEITGVRSWYQTFVHFQPDIGAVFSFAMLRTYGWSLTQNYGPFLWTMVIELWGSLIVFAISQSNRYLREPYSPLLLCTVIAIIMFPLAACFFVGALIALAERDGILFRRAPGARESAAATALLVVFIGIAAIVQMTSHDHLTLSLFAVGIVLATKRSLPASRVLELPVSQTLGKLSFPLYLAQFAVIISFSAELLIWFDGHGALNAPMAVVIAIVSTLISVALAAVLMPVEIFTLLALRRFDGLWARRRTPVAAVLAPVQS